MSHMTVTEERLRSVVFEIHSRAECDELIDTLVLAREEFSF